MKQGDAHLRVARFVGDEWEYQEITAVEDVVRFDFALGSAGRRALIIYNEVLGVVHQYLVLDTGAGDFTVEYNSDGRWGLQMIHYLTSILRLHMSTALTTPWGELDTVVSLYSIANGPDIDIMYIRADGVAPISEAIVGGPGTLKVHDLGLTTFTDNMARATIPVNGLLESDCVFGMYSAVVDGWGPAGISNWEELYLGTSANP